MKIPKNLYRSSKTITKTSALLLPTIGLTYTWLSDHKFVNAFLKDKQTPHAYTDEKKYIFLLFDVETGTEDWQDLIDEIKDDSSYIGDYSVRGRTMVVMGVPQKWNEVYDKFVLGQYSKIPREYVKQYFKPRLYDGQDRYGLAIWRPSKNYLILTGSDLLRKQIEFDLNVELPEDAEVFSKPNEFEFYGTNEEGYRLY